MGIQSLVTIQEFQYPQHNSYNITTRGLASIRNISKGEIVISVPFHALLTLPTTIDHDPVLSQIMGPTARLEHGWTLSKTKTNHRALQDNNDDIIVMSYYETALLTVAILYHVQLNTLSPQWFYMDILLQTNLTSIPFYNRTLLSSSEYHHHYYSYEVQYITHQIQKDIQDMYQNVMVPLIEEHAHIFGKPIPPQDKDDEGHSNNIHDTEQEWMYSYEKFEWAFAIVHSRHWHLPLQDLDDMMNGFTWNKEKSVPLNGNGSTTTSSTTSTTTSSSTTTGMNTDSIQQMPASMPTEEYISLQELQQQREEEETTKMQHVGEYIQKASSSQSSSMISMDEQTITKHSFMAPLADMMNFGPPCTRGQYNTTTKAFEVIATCDFVQGQEITFWYSDACDDVMMANYGFIHPLLPKCPTVHDWKKKSDMWKKYAEELERLIGDVYQDLNEAIDDLKKCDCSNENVDAGSSIKKSTTVGGTMTRKKWKEEASRVQKTTLVDTNNVDTTPTDDVSTTTATTTATVDEKPPPLKVVPEDGPRRIRRNKVRDMDEEHEDIGL